MKGVYTAKLFFKHICNLCLFLSEGESRKDKEQEMKAVMKRLESKYASLQVVPVIGKFGNTKVTRFAVNNE